MSSYDKVVKLACKPKAAPPKAKYLDPIIAATWSDDGAVHDVCKALSPRFREPNSVVVFKALIVLHTMIRNGATDNVLSYLSSSEVLRLQNVSAGNWEGYSAPQNLQHYAVYLDSRIRAYRDLKHDAIRVQAESNRDMRNSASVDEDNYARGKKKEPPASSGPQRSKTIMGRKLRVMTVEKGLLRETKAVHRMIDTLVECKFYLDDLEDELTTTALRMLVKDLLILFQAGNEGVINVLEHYFEMSHVDAEQALAIYRHFCKQTELVVEFLGVAKKLQNILNVPIPNLKHAPVSLAGALEEYLNDSNFEQNRIEYKTNKEAAQRGGRNGTTSKPTKAPSPVPPLPTPLPTSPPISASTTPASKTSAEQNKAITDFFSGIEEEQPTMFNPQTNSPNSGYFQQQGTVNPFVQRGMAPQFGQPQMQPQPTGFIVPQQTFMQPAPNPFGMMMQQQQSQLRLQPQSTGHRPFSSFLPPQQTQPTGMLSAPQQQAGFLQAQATGGNPFRQSMMIPQTTGMAMFGVGGMQQQQLQPTSFGNSNGDQMMKGGLHPQYTSTLGSAAFSPTPTSLSSGSFSQQTSPMSSGAFSQQTSPFSAGLSQQTTLSPMTVPARPASTPLTAFGSTQSSMTSPPPAQPIKTHQTGTRNPFGPIPADVPPPVPKQPTLMELTMGAGSQNGNAFGQQQQQSAPQLPQPTGFGGFSFNTSALNPGASDMSSIASSFTSTKKSETSSPPSQSALTSSGPLNYQNTSTTTTGSAFSDSLFSSSLSTQPTGATSISSPSISFTGGAPLKSQSTGFSGLKPFKPSSSFGASLLESLPPIPGSAPATPAITGAPSTSSNGLTNVNFGSGGFGSQPTGLGQLGGSSGMGSTLGQGLRPQMTGGGPNPFRASMFGATPNGNGVPAMPTGMGGIGGMSNSTTMGGNLFGSSFHTSNYQNQQQQGTSLI